jgi:membrane protein DedA with SNARE-associated domain
MKKLFLIPMAVCWLYVYSMVFVVLLILLAILGSVFVPNNVLTNLLGFLTTLGDAGFMGLIVLITIVGLYYLAYRLYLYFKTKAS